VEFIRAFWLLEAGNPAVSFLEIRGFPTPPRDGCGFISFPFLTGKQGTSLVVSIAVCYLSLIRNLKVYGYFVKEKMLYIDEIYKRNYHSYVTITTQPRWSISFRQLPGLFD
jgi:hypothetical protein